MSDRPRILLMPTFTEIEWAIKPLLEEWAEVASYDAPGVGDEPPMEGSRIDVNVERGLAELDARGWNRCVVVGDDFGTGAAIRLAAERPEAVEGLALGHACLEYRLRGPNPTLHPHIADVGLQLIRTDFRTFVHQSLGVWEPSRVGLDDAPRGEALAEEYLRRVPAEAVTTLYDELLSRLETEGSLSVEEPLRAVGAPLLLVQHEDCVFFTPEGFEEAAAAFPDAPTLRVPESPGLSGALAETLREFCEGLAAR